MKEIWKRIKGYRKFYKVSTKGRVKSLARMKKGGPRSKIDEEMAEYIRDQHVNKRRTLISLAKELGVTYQAISYTLNRSTTNKYRVRGKIIKQGTDDYGYKIVGLCKNGTVKTFKVHRLVAEAFIPNPLNKPEVNHKKAHRKDDNSVENLEWATRSENEEHNKRLGIRRGSKNGNSKIDEYDVKQIRKRLDSGELQRCIAKDFNVSQITVSLIKRRQIWKHI